MKDVAPEDRPKVGQMVNETRAVIERCWKRQNEDGESDPRGKAETGSD